MSAGETGPDLPAEGWRDDVPRRAAFEAANPDIEITSYEDGFRWSAAGTLANGIVVNVGAPSLGALLDRLGAA